MPIPLPMPDPATRDPRSIEMIRVWIAENRLHTVLNIAHWEDPKRGIDERPYWGILLADMIRHIANAHETRYGRDPRETVKMIQEMFQKELAKPTSSHPGNFA